MIKKHSFLVPFFWQEAAVAVKEELLWSMLKVTTSTRNSTSGSSAPTWFLLPILWKQTAVKHTVEPENFLFGTKGLASVCVKREWLYFSYHIQLCIIKTIILDTVIIISSLFPTPILTPPAMQICLLPCRDNHLQALTFHARIPSGCSEWVFGPWNQNPEPLTQTQWETLPPFRFFSYEQACRSLPLVQGSLSMCKKLQRDEKKTPKY